jgi:hypothetical protein
MGLRPLDLSRWLEPDGDRAADLQLKRALLDSPGSRHVVLAVEPGTEPAGRVLLDLITADLDRRGLVTGEEVGPGGMHPIEAASRLVQEDLCLMSQRDGRWVLSAACVCFPSRWSLREKVGRDLSGIHAPVPGYEETLARPTRAFFDRISPDRPVWRLNWTLLTDPALYQPTARLTRCREGGWFRVERQTLRRITPDTVVFTIRTYVRTLEDVLAAYPEAASTLARALTDLPPEVLDYKGWHDLAPAVRARLSEAGQEGAGPLHGGAQLADPPA